jgi:predicted AlkP superfamily pyrophosphatase or phosphodiesterase
MASKLIVLMLDGVSADYFATERARLPHLSALADQGLVIDSLHAEVCGTSLPGRTSMMTGVTADVSGVYGNLIWDGQQWRYANPYDVRVPTVPGRAKEAGLDVAVVGFGMVRPEDTTIFKYPWWVGAFIQRARDSAPVPSGDGWVRCMTYQNPDDRFEQIIGAAGFPTRWPTIASGNPSEGFIGAISSDQYAFNWVGILAAAEKSPDLIIAEVLVTDSLQHSTGYKSDASHWACAYVDMQVGIVIERLRSAGKLDEYNIAVMSDHGHSAIDLAIHPAVIIPEALFQCEGSLLHVIPKDDAELADITARLAAYGVTPYNSNHIPTDYRTVIKTFAAPEGAAFEHDPAAPVTEPTGKPAALSSHGLVPGMPGDDRFCVFAGPNVPQRRVAEANAVQVAPTLAALLGLSLEGFPAAPVFEPSTEGAVA